MVPWSEGTERDYRDTSEGQAIQVARSSESVAGKNHKKLGEVGVIRKPMRDLRDIAEKVGVPNLVSAIDQLNAEGFGKECQGIPIDLVVCTKCHEELEPSDLLVTWDYEMSHRLNKGKTVHDPDLHMTQFRSCPFCRKLLFADGKYIGRL